MSFSTAKASISGNSVVPGLPNRTSTPSCFKSSRKARFPDMTGKLRPPIGSRHRRRTNGHLGVRGFLRFGEDDLTGPIVERRGDDHKGGAAHSRRYNALALSRNTFAFWASVR